MDYTQQKTLFKIKKTLRYLRLYGPMRTLIKVMGQYHMKKEYVKLPDLNKNNSKGRHVGIIGCGNYAYGVIGFYLKKNFKRKIKASMDVDLNRAASLAEKYNLSSYSDNPREIINDENISLIYIASNHFTHAEYAIQALKNNKSVHIEKPRGK